jgi:hypothetical protein
MWANFFKKLTHIKVLNYRLLVAKNIPESHSRALIFQTL